jgi:hypothetical protein
MDFDCCWLGDGSIGRICVDLTEGFDFRCWPDPDEPTSTNYVGSSRTSGLEMLTVSLSHADPNRTLRHANNNAPSRAVTRCTFLFRS